jgi:hypothetical protein
MLDFGAVNFIAVAIAAVISFMFGAAYYGGLAKPWMKAANKRPEDANMSAALFATTFVCQLVMATVFAGIIGLHASGGVTLESGMATGFFLWLGVMATVTIINQRYEGFGWDLHLIDAGHWLGVALIMGAVIGWWG